MSTTDQELNQPEDSTADIACLEEDLDTLSECRNTGQVSGSRF
jgi:hypothetical protein